MKKIKLVAIFGDKYGFDKDDLALVWQHNKVLFVVDFSEDGTNIAHYYKKMGLKIKKVKFIDVLKSLSEELHIISWGCQQDKYLIDKKINTVKDYLKVIES